MIQKDACPRTREEAEIRARQQIQDRIDSKKISIIRIQGEIEGAEDLLKAGPAFRKFRTPEGPELRPGVSVVAVSWPRVR